MVISKKINHRKRKRRENFFGVPYIPLIIFLVLLILLFIIPPIEWQGRTETTPRITGKVVEGLQLTETSYRPKEFLEGDLNLNFYQGDLIAWDTNVTFDITAVKCKNYYVCAGGYKVPWEFYNVTSGKCENITLWVYGPWDECGEDKYYEYPGPYGDIECNDLDAECCKVNEGIGKFYTNIKCGSGKECWDDCKMTIKNTFLDSIALSSTPWKGNYTSGEFNNVNGSEPVLPYLIWGFGACSQIAPVPNYTQQISYATYGYAVQQPYYVDLTVLDIYTSTSSSPTFTSSVNPFSSDVAPSQSINNLYAKIKNQGTLISRPFSIIACWYNPQNPSMRAYFGQSQPIPKNCFKIVRVSYGLAPGETRVINLGNWDVQGKIVQVKVDYYNEIPENNENNNEMIKNFGGGDVSPITCIDPDGLNYSVKSTCMDSLGGHTDYCSSDTENVLVEYYCPISGQPMCTPTQYVCSSPNICIDGKCSELGVLKSDLIITNIERKSYGTIEGTKITMMNNGTAPVSGPRSFFTKVTYYLGTEKWEQEYQIQNLGYVPGATFILEVKDKDIKGKAVDISAFVDSKDDVDELNENNNGLSVWLSPYSCEGWNNIYEIALEDFGLRAPKYENVYVLKTEMVYGSTVLSSEEALFTVEEKEPTHKACQNNKCVRISGAGSDQCETNSDCAGGGSCNENWLYGQWSNCVGGKRRRLCYDANHCNTTYSKPSNCLYYVDGYYQTESCCVPNWQCDEWSVCYKLQGELVQSMTCRDINECEPENSSYTQYRDCCIENWDCKWTACMNGMQQKICEDINYCGTEFTKPVTEIRECEKQGIAWWVWLIIILVLIIVVLAILIGTGRLPWFKKKPKTEEAKKYPQLQDYIKKASERGMTKEQVRTKLIESGWPEDIVNKNLK